MNCVLEIYKMYLDLCHIAKLGKCRKDWIIRERVHGINHTHRLVKFCIDVVLRTLILGDYIYIYTFICVCVSHDIFSRVLGHCIIVPVTLKWPGRIHVHVVTTYTKTSKHTKIRTISIFLRAYCSWHHHSKIFTFIFGLCNLMHPYIRRYLIYTRTTMVIAFIPGHGLCLLWEQHSYRKLTALSWDRKLRVVCRSDKSDGGSANTWNPCY